MIHWGFRGVSIPSVVYIALIKNGKWYAMELKYVRFFMCTSQKLAFDKVGHALFHFQINM